MSLLATARELLARRAAGAELSPTEFATLQRAAKTLRRRLERLQALYPEVADFVSLSAELDELAQPPVLTASN